MMFRNIANPRRTTLAHLEDADALQTPQQPEHSVDLPTQTANPRRTILVEVPATAAAMVSQFLRGRSVNRPVIPPPTIRQSYKISALLS